MYPLNCSGARLARSPEAGLRARARDERVARGRRRESAGEGVAVNCVRMSCGRLGHTTTATYVRNRLGRVWLKLVSVCRAVVLIEHSPPHTYRIGWGGCGQMVPGCRGVVLITQPPHTYRIGSGVDSCCVTTGCRVGLLPERRVKKPRVDVTCLGGRDCRPTDGSFRSLCHGFADRGPWSRRR